MPDLAPASCDRVVTPSLGTMLYRWNEIIRGDRYSCASGEQHGRSAMIVEVPGNVRDDSEHGPVGLHVTHHGIDVRGNVGRVRGRTGGREDIHAILSPPKSKENLRCQNPRSRHHPGRAVS